MVTCRGELDPVAGYLIDIKAIDAAVRETLVPWAAEAHGRGPFDPCGVLASQVGPLARKLGGRLESVRWCLTPYSSWEIIVNRTQNALLRQKFDFAASHRLHIPGLSDQENTNLFGKCSRANGHGHNYQIEPCVEVAVDAEGRSSFGPIRLEEIVSSTILDRFDHTHLNLDSPEFSQPGGVNPTVENIAKVFFHLLEPAVSRESGATLRSMTVWETDRTSATYGTADSQ